MPSNRVEFVGSQGEKLAARLDLPVGPPRAYGLFAHCFTCSKDVLAASRISRELSARGIAVLRFDFTGLGHSEGEFANTNFSSNIEDLVLAAAWLRAEHEAPSLLLGHSLGGAAVLAAAHLVPEAVAVVTIGAPEDPQHVKKLLVGTGAEISEAGETDVEIAGRRFTIRKQFFDDLQSHSLEDRIRDLGKALLVLHSPADVVVDIKNGERIFEVAKHPKTFVSLDGADHLLTRREDAAYVAEVLAAWTSRYLPNHNEQARPDVPAGVVTVHESSPGKFTQRILAGRHELVADEPASVGGNDDGPTPYDLLLASLGACTSMTLRMYAERKELALDHVGVRLRHRKIHATDCESCETKDGWVDHIDREITIDGDLDEAQRRRLLEIADRCPVHRTLNAEVQISTRYART